MGMVQCPNRAVLCPRVGLSSLQGPKPTCAVSCTPGLLPQPRAGVMGIHGTFCSCTELGTSAMLSHSPNQERCQRIPLSMG